MAGGKQPPDKTNQKNFACHPKTAFNFVICLICENAYHQSDYSRKKNTGIRISECFVICPEHKELNIASTFEENNLNSDARAIIAQTKLFERSKYEDELIKHVSNRDLTGKSAEKSENYTNSCDTDIEALKRENLLYKQINKELKHNNKLLYELLDKEKKSPNMTYSAVVNQSNLTSNKNEHVPGIIVSAKDKKLTACTFEKVIEKIQTASNIQIKKVFSKTDGTVNILCKNKCDITVMEKVLSESLSDKFKVAVQKLNNPRIKIINIHNKMTSSELQDDINSRNFSDFQSKCSVIHTYFFNNVQNAIIELTSELYQHIRNNDNYIYVGHQRCKSFDDFNMSLCGKCGGLGHNMKKCRNQALCINCAGAHCIYECKQNEIKKCLHCIYSNKNQKKNRPIDHMANDVTNCETLKAKINNVIAAADYPVMPMIPTHLRYPKKIKGD